MGGSTGSEGIGEAAPHEGRRLPQRETPNGEDPKDPTNLDELREADVSFGAKVRMRELRFREVPEHETRFFGSTERESVAGTERENLPYGVREGEEYRDAKVRLRIASRIVVEKPGSGPEGETDGADR